jgi:hypothetical protein
MNPEGHRKSSETKARATNGETKVAREMHEIYEVEGGVEVMLPNLYDMKLEHFVGTSRERFATRQEAERAVAESRENERILKERASLEKTYGAYFYRIDRTKDGTFRVVLPGLYDMKSGHSAGVEMREFATWDEAKDCLLERARNQEKLTSRPILEMRIGTNERIAFSRLDAFNPFVPPSDRPHDVPEILRTYLLDKEKMEGTRSSASTYRETTKEKGWERNLFAFISSYLRGAGAETAKELGIERLEALTPRQAVELSTRIVIDLTKYKWSDTERAKNGGKTEPQASDADKRTVEQLLTEGLRRRNDPEWEGNGVCRNFASAVKAVFEALKANQTRFSRLRDTYALFEGGFDEFDPKRAKKNVTETGRVGHAWNTFVTISREGSANATVIDATWARRNLDTGKVEDLDHTLLRMEPVVHEVGKRLPEGTPDREDRVRDLLGYYALKIEGSHEAMPDLPSVHTLTEAARASFRRIATEEFAEKVDLSAVGDDKIVELGQRFVAEAERLERQRIERQFIAGRAVELMGRQGVPKDVPASLVEAIGEAYQELDDEADRSEVETLYRVSLAHPGVGFGRILRGYLKNRVLSDYEADAVIFSDDALQRLAYDELKRSAGYDAFVKVSPKFRSRMREAAPALFPDFSPGTKPEDALELKYLIGRSRLLERSAHMIDARNPSEQKAARFFASVREKLRTANPERYEEFVGGLDDYQVIKRFDRLYAELLPKPSASGTMRAL